MIKKSDHVTLWGSKMPKMYINWYVDSLFNSIEFKDKVFDFQNSIAKEMKSYLKDKVWELYYLWYFSIISLTWKLRFS